MDSSALRKYAIGILVFSAIMYAGFELINGFYTVNPENINDADYARFSTFSDQVNIKNNATDVGNNYLTQIEGADGDAGGGVGWWDAIFGRGWKIIQQFGRSYSFMNAVFDNIAFQLGIPPWLVEVVIAIIAVTLAFAIFSAIFGRNV